MSVRQNPRQAVWRNSGLVLMFTLISLAACAPATVSQNQPSDREWTLLTADYQWLLTLRDAQKKVPPAATRKEQIEAALENMKKLEPASVLFIDKLREYWERTGDPRAGSLLAREKIILGDQYVNILARYDKGLTLYREALSFEPENADALARIAATEARRFVAMTAFAAVKQGMSEEEVRKLVGVPREDWIKQVIQKNRVYSVWIYPKSDGGAAAIYFDNGFVYHTNWNAAAPQSQPAK